MKNKFAAAATAALLFGVSLGPVMAQDNTASGSDPNNANNTTVTTQDNDRGFDWGWLGLLGLLGLMPRKQKVVHQDTVRTNTNNTGTMR